MEAAWPVPEDLVVYGGIGKAARNWECFDKIVKTERVTDIGVAFTSIPTDRTAVPSAWLSGASPRYFRQLRLP